MQSDDFDPVAFIQRKRAQDVAWAALQGPLAQVFREPAMVMLSGAQATHLRGFDLTRKLCETLKAEQLLRAGDFTLTRRQLYERAGVLP